MKIFEIKDWPCTWSTFLILFFYWPKFLFFRNLALVQIYIFDRIYLSGILSRSSQPQKLLSSTKFDYLTPFFFKKKMRLIMDIFLVITNEAILSTGVNLLNLSKTY